MRSEHPTPPLLEGRLRIGGKEKEKHTKPSNLCRQKTQENNKNERDEKAENGHYSYTKPLAHT